MKYKVIVAEEEKTKNLEGKSFVVEYDGPESDLLNRIHSLLQNRGRQVSPINGDEYQADFLDNLAHDLRSPLNSILLLSQLMQRNMERNLTEKQIMSVGSIYDAGQELLKLINDMIDLSRIDTGKIVVDIKSFHLTSLVDWVNDAFARVMGKANLAFIIEAAIELPTEVVNDQGKIEKILKHLIDNAMQNTDKGEIKVRVRQIQAEEATIYCMPLKSLAIEVLDTGIGIAADKLTAIFEPFVRLETVMSRKHRGNGLGLTHAQKLAARLGGAICVHSEVGKGSDFTLLVPFEAA